MNVVRKSVNIVDSCFQFTLLPFHDYFMGCLKSRYLDQKPTRCLGSVQM